MRSCHRAYITCSLTRQLLHDDCYISRKLRKYRTSLGEGRRNEKKTDKYERLCSNKFQQKKITNYRIIELFKINKTV